MHFRVASSFVCWSLLTPKQRRVFNMSVNTTLRSFLIIVISVVLGVLYFSAEHAPIPPFPQNGLYPGDSVIPEAVMVYDQTRLINACPMDVWPWVQQVGKSRGGERYP